MGTFYVDGHYVSAENATLPVTDLSVLRGYGAFDFMRTYNGIPFEVDAHIQRLFNTAELLMLDMHWTAEEITDIVYETLRRNDYPESTVRVVVTGGTAPSRIVPVGNSRLIVMVEPVTELPPHQFAEGVKLITVKHNRFAPAAKSINYIPAILALKQAQAQNAVDALFLNDDDVVLEGTTNNLFIFVGDTLVTHAPEAILPGITRRVVMELADGVFDIVERDFTLHDLYSADEAFLTSSIKEVLPVRQVNDMVIGNGVPGANTRRLMALFAARAGIPVRA